VIGTDVDAVVFSGQVTSIKLVPSVDNEDNTPVLDGGEVAGDRKESWQIEGDMYQDFGATDSTTEYLFNERGSVKPFVYTPSSAMGKQIRGSLIVEAIEIGGEVKTKPISGFEFKLVGPPVIEAILIP
jgi:hypothetical protein